MEGLRPILALKRNRPTIATMERPATKRKTSAIATPTTADGDWRYVEWRRSAQAALLVPERAVVLVEGHNCKRCLVAEPGG
jgi:hypothetical protein